MYKFYLNQTYSNILENNFLVKKSDILINLYINKIIIILNSNKLD